MPDTVTITKDERKYCVLVTSTGQAKIAAATLRGERVEIADAAVGDGGGAFYEPLETQTALKREVWRGPVAGVEINEKSPNMIDARIVIPGDVGGWTVREAGLFDHDGDLIAVANYPETEKAIITEGVSATLEILLHVLFTNAHAVSFSVDPSMDTASVTEGEVEIPASGWRDDGGDARYPYVLDVPCALVSAFHLPTVILDVPSLGTAVACGLCPTVQTLDGALRFRAQCAPSGAMSGRVALTRPGGAGGIASSAGAPIATAHSAGGSG